MIRFRLRPGNFFSGKRTTVTLWRCGLVKYQKNILKNRITYRKAGRDVRTNERCSSQVTRNCPSNVTVLLSAPQYGVVMKGTSTTRARGRSLKEVHPLKTEEHPTMGDAHQEGTLEVVQQPMLRPLV